MHSGATQLSSGAFRLFLNLARRDPHDFGCVADHVGWALLAFEASGHLFDRPSLWGSRAIPIWTTVAGRTELADRHRDLVIRVDGRMFGYGLPFDFLDFGLRTHSKHG
jgi:hypothetical protein